MSSYLLPILLLLLPLVVLLLALPLKKVRSNLIYMIMPLNIFADICIQFFGGTSSIHSGILRAPIIAFIAIFCMRKVKLDKLTITIMIFLVYLLILVLFSSNLLSSLNTYVKVTISFLMIPIAYYGIKDLNELKKLHISLLIAVLLLQFNYILSQVFHLGEKAYSEEAFYLGGSGVYLTYILCYAIAAAPLTYSFLQKQWSKHVAATMYVFCVIIIIITFRRGSLLALFTSFLVMLYLSDTKYKKKILGFFLASCFVFIIFFPLYGNLVITLFEERIVEGYGHELGAKYGRIEETKEVWSELIDKSLNHSLFGSNMFNSAQDFKNWQGGRPLHIDYNNILYGSGIIGLSLFFLIIGQLIFKFRFFAQHSSNTILSGRIRLVFWSVLVTGLTLSLSHQWGNLSTYSTFCILIGSTLRGAQLSLVAQRTRMLKVPWSLYRPTPHRSSICGI